MALIGTIRRNSWILILTVGLGLLAFILMDITSGDKSIFGSSRTVAGSIDGEKVDWNDINRAESMLSNSGGDPLQRREQIWDLFVENKLVKKEAEALGLGVSRDEIVDLQFSQDKRRLSPIIVRNFTDPNTGQLSFAQLNQIKADIDAGKASENPDFVNRWIYQKEQIIASELQSKIENLVDKSIYTPTWMAEMMNSNDGQKADFEYVKIPFDNIDEASLNMTDQDYTNYINENKGQYTYDDEVRKVDYVTFTVVPTAQDEEAIRTKINELIPEFKAATNDTLFVENNYGTITGAYEKKSNFNSAYADQLFEVPVGTVVGPYKDGGAFKAFKVLGRKIVPDSVRSRHILMKANDQAAAAKAYQTLDSLKTVLESGDAKFSDLAKTFSQGPSASKGGDLGYAAPKQMVPQFNDLIFYTAKKGEYNIIATQFGLHLVEVTGYKNLTKEEGVRVATISQNIIPSEETIGNVNNKVLEFLGKNANINELIASAEADPALTVQTSQPLKKNAHNVGVLGSSQSSRNIVKWAFDATIGAVSPEVYIYQNKKDFYDEKFVIAALRSVQPKGIANLDFIRDEIAIQAKNFKKGKMIAEKVQGKDLASISSVYSDATIQTSNGVSFGSAGIPNIGREPKVLAAVFGTSNNATSVPVVGNSGVYVVKPTNKVEAPASTNTPSLKKSISSRMKGQVKGLLVDGLKKDAKITDNRSLVQ